MKKLLIILILVALLFTSCNAATTTLSGRIVEVNYDSSAILIESYDLNGLVWVGFDDEFKFSFGVSDELHIGNEIEIKAKPEIMESYPMQAFGIKVTSNK